MDWQALSNYGGFILGAIGLILAIYLYYKSKESKEPVYFYLTFEDIKKLNKNNPKIKVIYDNQEVEGIFTSYFWLWNRGRRPISKSDIPSNTQLRLVLETATQDLQILDWRIIKTSRDATKFQVKRIDKTTLGLDFDFIDYNDGAVIEIQHTGNEKTEIKVNGVVLGCPEGAQRVIARINFNIFGVKAIFGKYSNQFREFARPPKLNFGEFMSILSTPILMTLVYFDVGSTLAKETVWFLPSYIIVWIIVISFTIYGLIQIKKYPFPNTLFPKN